MSLGVVRNLWPSGDDDADDGDDDGDDGDDDGGGDGDDDDDGGDGDHNFDQMGSCQGWIASGK